MGLDNGICVENLNIKKNRKYPTYEVWEFGHLGELTYWRKCWNIRDKILQYLKKEHGTEEVTLGGNYILNVSDLKKISYILKTYSKKEWEHDYLNRDTIWKWKQVRKQLKLQSKTLKYFSKHFPNAEYYFYDSY